MFHSVHIQRYLTKNKIVQFFEDEGLYFRRIDKFADKTEGMREYFGPNQKKILEGINFLFKKEYPDAQDMSEEEGAKLALNVLEFDRQRTFIQSWFWDNKMSDYMWDEYAERNRDGDCAILVADRMRLSDCLLAAHSEMRMKPVDYVDSKLDKYDGVFPKLKEYKPENEFRLAVENICPKTNTNQKIVFKDDFGFILKLDLKDFISGVIIPFNASKQFEDIINQKLKDIKSECSCLRLKE